jgi:MFS family permease
MSDVPPSIYRDRDLYFFVTSRFIATLAIQVQSVAIGWQVYDMERTPLALGLVGLCQFLPMFLLTLPAGDITDRFNQRRVYSLAAGLQATCSILFLLLSIFRPHTAWMYFVVLVLFGAARGFAGPPGSSLLPFLVPPERISKSMAFSSSFFTAATISGPALGGFLYALGPVHVYSICIAGFIGAALIVARLGGRRFVPEATAASRYERVAEGVKFVRSRPVVLGAISLDLFAVLLGGATALLPVYARDILHVGPEGFGILRAAPSAGAIATGFVLAARPPKSRVGLKMFAAVGIYGLSTLVFALSRSMLLSATALAILGAADMVSVFVRQTLVQIVTPDAMRGRVSAVSSLFIGASNELGEFESGGMARLLGPVGSAIFGGCGAILVTLLWAGIFPALRKADKLE